MGDRYHLTVKCPECDYLDEDAYYAPSCGFTKWKCHNCGYMAELVWGVTLGRRLTQEEYEQQDEEY